MINKHNLLKRRDFSQLFSLTFDLFREEFKTFFKALLLLASIYLIIDIYTRYTFNVSLDSPYPLNSGTNSFDVWVFIFVVLLKLMTQILSSCVMFTFLTLYNQKPSAEIKYTEILRRSFSVLLKIFAYNFIFWFSTGIMITIVVILIVVFKSMFFGVLFGMAAAAMMMYLYVIFLMGSPAIVHEGISVTDAVTRSGNLVRGSKWLALGIHIVMFLITGLISMIFGFVTLIVTTLYIALSKDGISAYNPPLWYLIFNGVISALGYIVGSLIPMLTGVMYFSQLEKVDAVGLIQRIENLVLPESENNVSSGI